MPKKDSQPEFYAVWATAWGPVGGVAGPAGLKKLTLPHYQPDSLADLLAWEHPRAVRDEEPFQQIIALSRAYFNGRETLFAEVACDLPGEGTFHGKVLRACREIPYGQTSSYGELARRIGRPDAARAVAAALGKNPLPLVVPCHRVLYSDGRLGGFSAAGGVELKRRMLASEAGDAGH
ncbi:MAG TPA: methylated-DNA--[protein]-cysteine S-methyltransferase [Phycisphaerae bacterium]|nr:methylated-DNA--[protein]-cysteine S-methyltransferase [Phycisphaerae bacterium]